MAVGAAVAASLLASHPAPSAAPGATGPATGTVAGQVAIVAKSSRRMVSAGAYPGRIVTLPAERDLPELSNVVVYVKAKPTAAAPARAVIRQVNEEFVPRVAAVTVGSVVEFPNDDLIFHNVFSLSKAAEFNLGRFPRGASKRQTFHKPGVVKVFCQLHSHMNALIRVFDHPYFAVPDKDGRFSIANVPAGEHQVVAWHERIGDVTTSVTIEPGRSSDLVFSLPLADAR
jgi:plastocyanin